MYAGVKRVAEGALVAIESCIETSTTSLWKIEAKVLP